MRLGIDPEDVNKDRIYGIQMRYGEVWGDLHGTGEKEFESLLPEGEQLWAVVGKPVHISKSQNASKTRGQWLFRLPSDRP